MVPELATASKETDPSPHRSAPVVLVTVGKSLTVTLITFVYPDHCVGKQSPPLLLYHLSAVNPDGGSYVSLLAPDIGVQPDVPLSEYSHSKDVAPPSSELVIVLGFPSKHIECSLLIFPVLGAEHDGVQFAASLFWVPLIAKEPVKKFVGVLQYVPPGSTVREPKTFPVPHITKCAPFLTTTAPDKVPLPSTHNT